MVCLCEIPGRAICDEHAAGDSNGNLATDGTLAYAYNTPDNVVEFTGEVKRGRD